MPRAQQAYLLQEGVLEVAPEAQLLGQALREGQRAPTLAGAYYLIAGAHYSETNIVALVRIEVSADTDTFGDRLRRDLAVRAAIPLRARRQRENVVAGKY